MVHSVLCICLEFFLAWTGCIINIPSSLNNISYSYIAYQRASHQEQKRLLVSKVVERVMSVLIKNEVAKEEVCINWQDKSLAMSSTRIIYCNSLANKFGNDYRFNLLCNSELPGCFLLLLGHKYHNVYCLQMDTMISSTLMYSDVAWLYMYSDVAWLYRLFSWLRRQRNIRRIWTESDRLTLSSTSE